MPVFKKVTALVMVPVAPLSWRLYPAVAVFKVAAVRAPLKAIVPVVAVKVVVVSLTVLVKVVPAEFCTVTVPMLVPIAPNDAVPVVLMTIFAGVPGDVPVIDATVMFPELPAPKFKVTPLPRTMLFKVIANEPKSTVVELPKNEVVPPKLNAQSEVPHKEGLVAVKVPASALLPVVWVIPRENVSMSVERWP